MGAGIIQRFLARPFSTRQLALAKYRPPLSQKDFVSRIAQSGGADDAAIIVRAKLQDWIYHDGFSPYPDDSLSSVFGIAEEELDEDIILDVLTKLGLSTPPQQLVEAFGPIDTAADIARFVARVRSDDGRQI